MQSEFIADPLKVYSLSPLTAGDREDFRHWAHGEALRLAEERIGILDRHGCISPWEKRQILDVAATANASGHTEEIAMKSPEGVITFAWLSLRQLHHHLTRGDVARMIPLSYIAELNRRLGMLNGVPDVATDAVESTAGEAESSRPTAMTLDDLVKEATAVRAGIFDAMCEEKKLTPKQLCDLPIEEIESLYKRHATQDKNPVDRLKLRQRLLEYAGINPAPPQSTDPKPE